MDEATKSLMLSKDDLRAAVNDDDVIKLDVRVVDECLGTSSSPYGADFCTRKGHLPSVVWIECYCVMESGVVLTVSTQQKFRLLPTIERFNDPHRADDIIRQLMRNTPDLRGIYIMGSGARRPVEGIKTYATDHNLVIIAHELTEFTKEQLTKKNS